MSRVFVYIHVDSFSIIIHFFQYEEILFISATLYHKFPYNVSLLHISRLVRTEWDTHITNKTTLASSNNEV